MGCCGARRLETGATFWNYKLLITGMFDIEKRRKRQESNLMDFQYQTLKAGLWTAGFLLSIIYSPEAVQATADPTSLNDTDVVTIQELAEEGAQSLKASSDVEPASLERSSYSATTAEEVAAIQAERERVAAEEAHKKANSSRAQLAGSVAAPKMSGNFAWPVTGYHINPSNNDFRAAERPDHNGLDMLCPAMTPIYAVHDGTVIMSSENSSGWGVVVKVRGIVDGKEIITTYAHMTYGTRQVQVGDTVKAGHHLGNVGMTGRATANHLHLEVEINGSFVNPRDWLETNLGPVG